MERLGGDAWFRLGDKDLALHLLRNNWLKSGVNLTEVTDRLRRTLDIPLPHPAHVQPTCPYPRAHRRRRSPFSGLFRTPPLRTHLSGADIRRRRQRAPSPLKWPSHLQSAAQIIICPSNPYLSVDPILSVPGLSDLVRASDAPVVAVSPIVGGRAVKGPVAKMMREMGPFQTPAPHRRRALRRSAGRIRHRPAGPGRAEPPSPAHPDHRYHYDRPALQATPGCRGPAVQPVTYGKADFVFCKSINC